MVKLHPLIWCTSHAWALIAYLGGQTEYDAPQGGQHASSRLDTLLYVAMMNCAYTITSYIATCS